MLAPPVLRSILLPCSLPLPGAWLYPPPLLLPCDCLLAGALRLLLLGLLRPLLLLRLLSRLSVLLLGALRLLLLLRLLCPLLLLRLLSGLGVLLRLPLLLLLLRLLRPLLRLRLLSGLLMLLLRLSLLLWSALLLPLLRLLLRALLLGGLRLSFRPAWFIVLPLLPRMRGSDDPQEYYQRGGTGGVSESHVRQPPRRPWSYALSLPGGSAGSKE